MVCKRISSKNTSKSWYANSKSWYANDTFFLNHGMQILNRGMQILNHGMQILNHGMQILNHGMQTSVSQNFSTYWEVTKLLNSIKILNIIKFSILPFHQSSRKLCHVYL